MTACDLCEGDVAPEALERSNGDPQSQLCTACRDLTESGSETLEVRPMGDSDLELVLAWRNDPDIYSQFESQSGEISWNDHVSWYRNRPEEREDYLIRYEGRRVGVISVDESSFVSVYVGEKPLWGEGIASRSLKWLVQRYQGVRKLQAKINVDNSRSRNLFTGCGFVQSDRDNEWLTFTHE